MIAFERTPRSRKQVNLIALIDINFVLLMFFMLTTSFMRIEAMDLALPGTGEAPLREQKPTATVIDLTNKGEVQLDNKTLRMDQLEQALYTLFNRTPEQAVLVRSGNAVSVQRLVGVLDTIRLAGGKAVAVDHLLEAREVGPITVSPEGLDSPQQTVDEMIAP